MCEDRRLTLVNRRPQQKAWTPGNNPITQRGSTPTQANGNPAQSKATSTPKMATQKEIGLSDKHGHDRLRFILAAAVVRHPCNKC